ncbi:DUF2690 domain-containing protein [Streptomyces sp. NPDC014983]|uniref:DUF2690 domain-containing protein n=1 Tax=Streptomyces sp. NPDC014983 TaxID=3364933 RepID=UPI0036FACC7E
MPGLDRSEEPAAELVALLNLIRRYMGELDWSYQVLERNTGVSRSTWNRWYTQKKLPKREALVKFADAAPRTVNQDELLGLWGAARQAQEAKQAQAADRVPDGDEQADQHTTATPATTSTSEQQSPTTTASHTEPTKRSGKKTGRVLAGIMSALVLGGGAALWVINASADDSAKSTGASSSASPPATSQATASPLTTCHGDSCASVEPKGTVCSLDAITAYTGRKFGATVELRYSPRCDAAWAKMSNTSPDDRVIITPKRGNSEEYRQQYGHDAHTRMVPVTRPEDARACAKIQDRGTVCATTSALSSPTPT